MPALRILTFNVQCLPLFADVIAGQSDTAKERATAIADAILAMPPGDTADVMAFNEVFSEDARTVFVDRLGGAWPNMVVKVQQPGLLEDAGLMLFSRFPFKQLPNGDTHVEIFYDASAGTDSLAQKAVCVVQITEPFDPTTIAFTHLQASYDTEDEHADIRSRQFEDIFAAVRKAVSDQVGPLGQAVALGDLNVRGDGGATKDEWKNRFEPPNGAFFERFLDGWKSYMHPPGEEGFDEGVTNMDPTKLVDGAELRQRLDYVCFSRPDGVDILLKPQHMRIRLRGLSDHFALEAVIQVASDFCTPSEAQDFLALPVNAGGGIGTPSSVRQSALTFAFDGSWQWLYVRAPGTYSFFTSPGAVYECFHQSNLSAPVDPIDQINLANLADALRNGLGEAFDPSGQTFATWEPFFVAVRKADAMAGVAVVGMVEHHGESAATAIGLVPWVTTVSSFPNGQPLGDDDLCWFKARLPVTLSGQPRTEPFEITNPTGRGIDAEIRDAAMQRLSQAAGADASLAISADGRGDDLVHLVLSRDDQTANGYQVTWRCPVGYLDLDEPIYLYVLDESGPDAFGADEPQLKVSIDTELVYEKSWDDADSGEWWPGLHGAIKARCAVLAPGKRRVGFVDEIFVTVFDPDFNAMGVFPTASFVPLAPGDPPTRKVATDIDIPDVVSDGRYRFGCTLTRFP